MVDGISPIINTDLIKRAQQATSDSERQKIKEEFLAIFYKEILKQTFQEPNLSPAEEKDNANSFGSAFSNDMLLNQMALELARTKSFSAATVLPDNVINGIGE